MYSIDEFYQAIRYLNDLIGLGDDWTIRFEENVTNPYWTYKNMDGNEVTGGTSDLINAAMAARKMSDNFKGVNESLYNGWITVADFMEKIDSELRKEAYDLHVAIRNFANITAENESQIVNSIDKANEEAANILAELGL